MYPDNMLVYISLSVPLECAFVAEELKCVMNKLNVRPQTTILCLNLIRLIPLNGSSGKIFS